MATALFGLLSMVGMAVFLIIGIVKVVKKKPAKKMFVGLGICFAVFVICLVIPTDDDDTTVTTEETTSADEVADEPAATKEEPKKKEEAEPEVKAVGLGESLKIGDMEYIIHSKANAQQVGDPSYPTKANGQYVVIDVTIKNNGTEATDVTSDYFKLVQGEKSYEADSNATPEANYAEGGNNTFIFDNLNPGSEMSGKMVFDVSPEVAASKDLKVQIQTGAFGTETDVINLQ
jgi:hypothetical protein